MSSTYGQRWRIENAADLPAAIIACESCGSLGMAHLLCALASHRIALMPILPETSGNVLKRFARMTAGRPAIAFFGDDDGLNRGPDAWPQAERIIRWADRIVLHAAGAEVAHYEAAIQAAELGFKILFVECCTATFDRWVELIGAPGNVRPTLLIVPREGQHPLPMRAEDLH